MKEGQFALKKYTSITEKQILYYAWQEIMRRQGEEEARLQANPNSPISKYWLNKYDMQLKELHGRILEIENAERKASER